MKKEDKEEKITDVFKDISADDDIPSDVLGSYVGIDSDGEYPIQDADDL